MSRKSPLGVLSGIFSLGGILLVAAIVLAWFVYTEFRIEVPTGKIAILIKKTGKDLANSDEIAVDDTHKGIQLEPLMEGRHFRNPYFYEWEVIDQLEVPTAQLAVLTRLYGEDLPYGEFLADPAKNQKGIIPAVLKPGRYPINTYAYAYEFHNPQTIPAGYKGVVTDLAGPIPDDPNRLLVEAGYRGVQQDTLDPGTYYFNPYVKRIHLVDCRSQRINLAEDKDLGFPSKDGFWVSLEGIVEFRVRPDKAAEVFVVYNEAENSEDIAEEIRRKVILPNARSFCRLEGSKGLAREFIQGETRKKFQDSFQHAMQHACEPLGIEIIQALITRINPPEKIAAPVRRREIAKQEESQYKQQILQQQSEQQLAVEKALVEQKQALVQAEQEVVQVVTTAKQRQEVAVTKAEEKLAVGKLALEASRDEALAIRARGKAEAEIVQLNNEAEAAGWKEAVAAFGGSGNAYARYVLYQKLAPAYQSIMANTADSPIMDIFRSFGADGTSARPENRPSPSATAALRTIEENP